MLVAGQYYTTFINNILLQPK